MSITFTKLFSSITASTVWCEDPETKVVWITMLAMADRMGRVSGSIPGLAAIARVSVDATRRAIDKFLSPDPDSRSKEAEGRRIESIDGGWKLINYEKYRELRDEEERKVYKREWMQKRRQASRQCGQNVDNVDRSRPVYPYAEADTYTEAEKKRLRGDARGEPRAARSAATRIPPDFSMTPEREEYARKQGIEPLATLEAFVDYWRAASGAKARKCDWEATWRTWCRRSEKPKTGAKPSAPGESAEWREAKARGEAIGFRPPHLLESAGAYMTQVKLAETRMPRQFSVAQLVKRVPC